jgi:hypothetical protein
MSEPENFLSRWSRRKATGEPPEPAGEAVPAVPAKPGEPAAKQAAAPGTPASAEPVFDPASLPSLDSIGAQTDISAFLKPGVPSGLRNAALRRAWSADPAIRDFKGLQENDWNFNDPNGIPGFGELSPTTDVKKMLAELFGETPRAQQADAESAPPPEQLTPPSNELSAASEHAALESPDVAAPDSKLDTPTHNETHMDDNLLHRDKNIAAQDDNSESDDAQRNRRRSQGGALPH